eukprot:5735859-Prymnesium_polylepis.1
MAARAQARTRLPPTAAVTPASLKDEGEEVEQSVRQNVLEAVQVAVWVARNGDGVVMTVGGGVKSWSAVRGEARAFAKEQPTSFSWWGEARGMKDVAGMQM